TAGAWPRTRLGGDAWRRHRSPDDRFGGFRDPCGGIMVPLAGARSALFGWFETTRAHAEFATVRAPPTTSASPRGPSHLLPRSARRCRGRRNGLRRYRAIAFRLRPHAARSPS